MESMGEVSRALRVEFCDIGETPSMSSREWDMYMSFMSLEEMNNVLKYRFDEDRRRALMSLFLQKSTVRGFLGAKSDTAFSIQRTPENKPFPRPCEGFDIGTWNYNLSHHGKYVGIASHPRYLVGCDIVDLRTRTRVVKNCEGYLQLFKKQLHDCERELILSKENEQERYNMFFIIWSLKEAYVKAIGQGLDFDWQSVYFNISYRRGADAENNMTEDEAAAGASGYCGFESEFLYGSAEAVIYGEVSQDWRFRFQSIDMSHIIAIALGPIRASLSSFRCAAWKKVPDLNANEVSAMAKELRAWAEDSSPIPLHHTSLLSLLSPAHQAVVRYQFTELPVSPPFVDLNNRQDNSSVVFKSVEERILASNHGTPALPEVHEHMPFSPFSADGMSGHLSVEEEEIPEAPWRVPEGTDTSITSDSNASAIDRVWTRRSYSPSTVTLSEGDIPTAEVNETTETNVSFYSVLDINSPAAWRQPQQLPRPIIADEAKEPCGPAEEHAVLGAGREADYTVEKSSLGGENKARKSRDTAAQEPVSTPASGEVGGRTYAKNTSSFLIWSYPSWSTLGKEGNRGKIPKHSRKTERFVN